MTNFDIFYRRHCIPVNWARSWFFFNHRPQPMNIADSLVFWRRIELLVQDIHRGRLLEYDITSLNHLPIWLDDWAENDPDWRTRTNADGSLRYTPFLSEVFIPHSSRVFNMRFYEQITS